MAERHCQAHHTKTEILPVAQSLETEHFEDEYENVRTVTEKVSPDGYVSDQQTVTTNNRVSTREKTI